ncbi:hypothetical protein EBZ38_14145 [bacterium]|nr:hypothetical protein [bacterium]NDD85399.1 hypothetical protein [bacterium]
MLCPPIGIKLPPTIEISYPLAENELVRKNQLYHKELMDANRKYALETIASKAGFKNKYPCAPTPRPNVLPNKNVVSGSRVFGVSSHQEPLPYVGSLSTFPNSRGGRLTGGVLKNYSYARKILDRRAENVRAQQDPAFVPPTKVLSDQDQLKLNFSSLLSEVVDSITANNYTDLVYSATRRLVGTMLQAIPYIDDPKDIADIKRVIDLGLVGTEDAEDAEQQHDTQAIKRDELNKASEARRRRILDVLDRINKFIELYTQEAFAVNKATIGDEERPSAPSVGIASEEERKQIARSVAREVGLFKFAVYEAPKQPSVEETDTGAAADVEVAPNEGSDEGGAPSEAGEEGAEAGEAGVEGGVPSRSSSSSSSSISSSSSSPTEPPSFALPPIQNAPYPHRFLLKGVPFPASLEVLRKVMSRAQKETLLSTLVSPLFNMGKRSDLQLANEIVRRAPPKALGGW